MNMSILQRRFQKPFVSGVYKHDGPYQAYMDIMGVPELKVIRLESRGVVLGGALTLADAIEQLQNASTIDGFEYTAQMSKHIQRVANVPIRNVSVIQMRAFLQNYS